MTRTNPRQPLWQRVKEEADYKPLGSAHDRQKLSTLADGARWEHGADAEKLATYAARHAAAQPAYDAAAARYAADDGDDDDRFAELPRIAKDVPRTFGGVDAPCAAAARAHAAPAVPGWALRLIGMAPPAVEEDDGDDKEVYDRRRAERLARLLNIGNEQLPYAQGMNFVAASILSECERGGGADEALAFGLYCYALRDLGCEKLYGRRLPAALAALDLSLRRHAPALHAHLAGCGFDPQLYAVEWLSALFVVSVPRTLSLVCFRRQNHPRCGHAFGEKLRVDGVNNRRGRGETHREELRVDGVEVDVMLSLVVDKAIVDATPTRTGRPGFAVCGRRGCADPRRGLCGNQPVRRVHPTILH